MLTKKVASFQSRSIIGIIINLKFLRGCTYANKKIKIPAAVCRYRNSRHSGLVLCLLGQNAQYSLGLIGHCDTKARFIAFEKHVDMETLYSSAYDDVVVASFGNERLASPILTALVQNIRNIAVPILIDQTRQYVNGGTMDEVDPVTLTRRCCKTTVLILSII